MLVVCLFVRCVYCFCFTCSHSRPSPPAISWTPQTHKHIGFGLRLLLVKLIPNEVRQDSVKFYLVLRCINRYKLRCEGIRFGMWAKYLLLFLIPSCCCCCFHSHCRLIQESKRGAAHTTMRIHDFWSVPSPHTHTSPPLSLASHTRYTERNAFVFRRLSKSRALH